MLVPVRPVCLVAAVLAAGAAALWLPDEAGAPPGQDAGRRHSPDRADPDRPDQRDETPAGSGWTDDDDDAAGRLTDDVIWDREREEERQRALAGDMTQFVDQDMTFRAAFFEEAPAAAAPPAVEEETRDGDWRRGLPGAEDPAGWPQERSDADDAPQTPAPRRAAARPVVFDEPDQESDSDDDLFFSMESGLQSPGTGARNNARDGLFSNHDGTSSTAGSTAASAAPTTASPITPEHSESGDDSASPTSDSISSPAASAASRPSAAASAAPSPTEGGPKRAPADAVLTAADPAAPASAGFSAVPAASTEAPCLRSCRRALAGLLLLVEPPRLLVRRGANISVLCRLSSAPDLLADFGWRFRPVGGGHDCPLGPPLPPPAAAGDDQCPEFRGTAEVYNVTHNVTTYRLEIPDTLPSESGQYTCEARARCCGDTAHVTELRRAVSTRITVYEKPRYAGQLAVTAAACVCLLVGLQAGLWLRRRRRRGKAAAGKALGHHYQPVRLLRLPRADADAGRLPHDDDTDDDEFDEFDDGGGGAAEPSPGGRPASVTANPLAEPLTPPGVTSRPPPPDVTSRSPRGGGGFEFPRPPSDLLKRLSRNEGFE